MFMVMAPSAPPLLLMKLPVLFIIAIITFLSLASSSSSTPAPLLQSVFISCNKHDGDQSYWALIAGAVSPAGRGACPRALGPPVDALVWLGDAVYADSPSLLRGFVPSADVAAARAKFMQQRHAPAYEDFRRTCVRPRPGADVSEPRVIGVWDDHDMGKNDGGAEYEGKDAMQQVFLDFLGVPDDHTDERRRQRGVYSFEPVPFGPETSEASAVLRRHYDFAACFLLLDVRYFRDPVNATRSGDMLGEAQWAWLEERLRRDVAGRNPTTGRERCALTVVGGGVQFIMDEKVSESWGFFPASRERLFALLRRHRAERVVFVSGDVHLGEIGMDAAEAEEAEGGAAALGFPVVEATSSGLTHSAAKFIGLPTFISRIFPSPRRVGVYVERNFGILRLTADPSAFVGGAGDALRQREDIEEHINVSIVIHSIALGGEAVVRLSLPLSALTYQSGCRFLNARVRSDGFVDLRNTAHEKCEVPIVRDNVRYPSTHPVPTLTYIASLLQWYVWPNYSLIEVLLRAVISCFVVFAVVILVIVLVIIFRKYRTRGVSVSSPWQNCCSKSEEKAVDKRKKA